MGDRRSALQPRLGRTLAGITACQYPTPGGIVTEAVRVLAPGGRLRLLRYMVSPYWTRIAHLVGVRGPPRPGCSYACVDCL